MFKEILRTIVPVSLVALPLVGLAVGAAAYENTAKPINPVDCKKNSGESDSVLVFIGTNPGEQALVGGQIIKAREPGIITVDNTTRQAGQDNPVDISLIPNEGLVFEDRSGTRFILSAKPSSREKVQGTNLVVKAICNPQNLQKKIRVI